MAKKVVKKIKLQAPGGQAVPNQKLGPALGQAGVNIGEFITRFNEASKEMKGDIVPVELSVYADRTFSFTLKTPPASRLLLKAIGAEKGSGTNVLKKAGKIGKKELRAIAEKKLPDLTATDIESAMKTIAGTARSMGIEVGP